LSAKLGELTERVKGGSLLEHKKALDAAGGVVDRAAEWLVEKGLAELIVPAVDEMDEALDDPEFQDFFLYMQKKAEVYLKVGPGIYRRQDAYEMPDEGWPDEWLKLIEKGLSQITNFVGYSAARPLRGLGMADLQRLLLTLHFEVVDFGYDPESAMGGIVGEHLHDEQQVALYFTNEAPRVIEGASGHYGFEPENPIPVDGPSGERLFLSCLRCACGEPFTFHRPGSVGKGPDAHVVDVFELVCRAGEHRLELFFDLYHPGSTPAPPEGLTLAAPWGVGVSACVEEFESMSFDDMVEYLTEE